MTDLDREAIIEAIRAGIDALTSNEFGPLEDNDRRWHRELAEAAYDASPLERYRLALEQIAGSPFGSSHEVDRGIAERALRGE